MSDTAKVKVVPSGLRYKLLVSFCLMSLLPILTGVYVVSLFVKFPFEASSGNLSAISLITLFSLSISFFGYLIVKQIFSPLAGLVISAQNIAEGKLDRAVLPDPDLTGQTEDSDEIEGLTKSLKIISRNARELMDKVDRLSLKDALTGFYNATYIRERLKEEIQRAVHYQRPCSFVYLNVDGFNDYAAQHGVEASEEALKSVAKIIERHLSEFDRPARIRKDEFVIIFPDKNKKKIMEIAEGISREIAAFSFGAKGGTANQRLTVCAGISENPMDGVSVDELFVKARDRMRSAKSKGHNIIEAFG